MAFKIVDSTVRPRGRSISSSMEISYYGKTAQFRLSPAAFKGLGEPERVEVLYDADANMVGIRASSAPHSVALRKDSKEASSRYFGFRSFANQIGYEKVNSASFGLEVNPDDAGMLIGTVVIPDPVTDTATEDEDETV